MTSCKLRTKPLVATPSKKDGSKLFYPTSNQWNVKAFQDYHLTCEVQYVSYNAHLTSSLKFPWNSSFHLWPTFWWAVNYLIIYCRCSSLTLLTGSNKLCKQIWSVKRTERVFILLNLRLINDGEIFVWKNWGGGTCPHTPLPQELRPCFLGLYFF